MKQLIETIKNSREQLISRYYEVKHKAEANHIGRLAARKNHDRLTYEKLEEEYLLLTSDIVDTRMAVNELGNALCHLGVSVDTFWGE